MDEISVELIERAQAGDRRAIGAVLESAKRPIYNLAVRMLLSPADAEDATQEALIKIAEKLKSFEGQSKLSTWIWTVSSRTFLDFRKSQYRHAMFSVEQFQADLQDGLDADAPERAEDQAALAQLKIGCARALLQTLDGDHRLAFVLGEILEMTSAEGAKIAGVAEATYRKRLSRARERVYDALRDHCGVVEPTASCLCHRRVDRARRLGRVVDGVPDPGVDLRRLRSMLSEIEDVYERGARYYRIDPVETPPPSLAERLSSVWGE